MVSKSATCTVSGNSACLLPDPAKALTPLDFVSASSDGTIDLGGVPSDDRTSSQPVEC